MKKKLSHFFQTSVVPARQRRKPQLPRNRCNSPAVRKEGTFLWKSCSPSTTCVRGFGGLEVLKDISLHVEKGQVVAIIGPSGSGKSTLLRCATMLETVDEGTICYGADVLVHTDEHGKTVYADKTTLKKIRSKFGLVFQNFNLFPHFSVLKNITEAQVIAGIDKKQAQEKARELLGKMGLADKEKAYPCQLSGGQQQRVSIARALALNPQVLFLR